MKQSSEGDISREPNEENVKAMSERVKLLRAKTFVVNSYPPGGTWVFEGDGTLVSSSRGWGALKSNGLEFWIRCIDELD